MKIFKGYKIVALVYLVVTLVNVVFICNYSGTKQVKSEVKKENEVVLNY